MAQAFTTNGYAYFNETYANTLAIVILRIRNNEAITSNLHGFFVVSSATSNQVWGGINRADIVTAGASGGAVTTADALEWAKAVIYSNVPTYATTNDRSPLVMDELYASWQSQGIGYYGDTTTEPLFKELIVNKTIPLIVGSRTGAVNNTYTYIGFDNGPFAYYGQAYNTFFVGKDSKLYVLHACRWSAGDNRVYIRLNADHILSSQSPSSYTTSVFDAIIINGTRFTASSISTSVPPSFIDNGFVGLYWTGVSTNPFSSVGTSMDIVFEGVGAGPYGFEVFSSTGDLVLSPAKQKTNIIDKGSVVVYANTTSGVINVAGMTPTNTDTVALIIKQGANNISFNRYNGNFTITNTNPADITVKYLAVRLK